MAYIGHFDPIPVRKTSASPRSNERKLARAGYYLVLGAIALVPIVAPLIAKHFGLSF